MTMPPPPPGPPPYGAPAPAPATGQVPPGWYPGPAGAPQWWDGRGWGPTAPPAADNTNTMAMFCHLGMLFLGFLVPLIILLTEGGRNRFVKHHATEALNWAITTTVLSIALLIGYIVALVLGLGLGAGASTGSGAGVAAGFVFAVVVVIVVVVVAIALGIMSLVFTITGAVRANQRRWYRYPFAIRWVKGAASKAEVDALDSGVV